MNLSKWVTNSNDLTQLAKGNIEFSMAKITLARDKIFDYKPNKALGIIWYPLSDKFSFIANQDKRRKVWRCHQKMAAYLCLRCERL